MHYYGTRLSENISRREPEGYLLCLNVPVARTGTQEYLPEELGLPRGTAPIPVYRPEEEVFSAETMASFEGMPVTNDHPPDGVDKENIRRLQAGHAHNIRRGTGAEADLLLADLIITDPCLIDAVLAGKREISCGYTYELHKEYGRYVQRKIRGNHIAVVDAGRAGSRVSIRDHRNERRKRSMNKALTRLLARMAKDGGAETVAEFIEEMMAENEPAGEPAQAAAVIVTEEPAPEPAEEPVTPEIPENREITVDEGLPGILERLDRVVSLLEALTSAGIPAESGPVPDGAPEEAAEEAAEEISGIVEEILEPVLSETAAEKEEDCGSPDPAEGKDTLRAVLLAVRPALAKMSPAQRRRVCGDIAANLRGKREAGDARVYAALASAARPAPELSDLGKRIMAARNPNYRQ